MKQAGSIKRSLLVLTDVVFALFLRELKTRFGPYRLGLLWAFIEPVSFVLIMSLLRTLLGKSEVYGVPMLMFFMLGYLPFQYFSKLLTQGAAAVNANRGLFHYRQVRPVDALLARGLLESLIHLSVIALLAALFAWSGADVQLHDPLLALVILVLVGLLGAGAGLIICIGQIRFSELAKIVPLVTRPLFFISGLFFSLSDVPAQYHVYLLWNPILHANELMRGAFYADYPLQQVSVTFLAGCSLVAAFLGLALYRLDWKRLVAT